MNKLWLIIEKIIGVSLFIWGIITLYTLTTNILNMTRHGYAAAQHITYFQLFFGSHINFFLAVAAIFGGFMLVFGDKPGWFLSIVCCALYIVTFFRSSQANMENTQPYYAFFKSYSIMALLFLAMFVLLIQKPFRKKYQATAKNWLWIAIIIIVVIIDKIIF